MVIADVNILIIGAVKKTDYLIPNAKIECYRMGDITVYDDRYQNVQKNDGWLYQISPKEREIYNYEQEFMGLCFVDQRSKIIFLRKEYKHYFANMITTLCKQSPSKRISFFVDLQGYKEYEEHVCMKKFMNLLMKEELFFNTVYYISE